MRTGGGFTKDSPILGRMGGAGGYRPAVTIKTAIGTAFNNSATSLSITGVNLNAGDLLLVADNANDGGGGNPASLTINGTSLVNDLIVINTNISTSIWRLKIAASIVGGTITASYGAAIPSSMIAVKFNNLFGTLLTSISAQFIATTAPDSGLAILQTPEPQAQWLIIGTAGINTDALGTWQNIFGADMRASTTIIGSDLKESYNTPNPPIQARAAIVGQTNRESNALAVVYK